MHRAISVQAVTTTHLSQPGARLIVAERAAHPLGFAQIALGRPLRPAPSRPAAGLDCLYVLERFTGPGQRTAADAEALAAAKGCAIFLLTGWTGDPRALAF